MPVQPAAGTPPVSHVVVVDDDPISARMTRSHLERAGLRVTYVDGGRALRTLLEAVIPDLILLDVMMPEQNGYQVCQQLQNQPATAYIPVLFLNGTGRSRGPGTSVFLRGGRLPTKAGRTGRPAESRKQAPGDGRPLVPRAPGHGALGRHVPARKVPGVLAARQGMLLITGPTGSGKTTTLYAAINRLNREGVNIVTVEDPVEAEIRGGAASA